ncbi:hypothetical protein P7K49_030131 [Saguinus oedipus]|uniref:Alpha-2-HS-glycoprotein n=1 Tax=Saguinus oedipus TaxID=9490 RepID=A0ABQ9U3C4_SAGOE|nr:hypothetical protein P7K49_030131 [Saguinus oedipus]
MFVMEIDTLETTCHALDPTPVANCSVRQLTEHAVEGDCDFRLLKLNGQFSVFYAKCDSSPDSAEDVRKVCQDCPLLAPLNDTRVVHAADAALAAFNAQNNGSFFQLEEISRAQLVVKSDSFDRLGSSVVLRECTPLPPSTYVEFTMSAPDCVAKEATEAAKCNLLAKKQYGFCKATLTEKLNGEEVALTCTVFQPQLFLSLPSTSDYRAEPSYCVVDKAIISFVGGGSGFLSCRDLVARSTWRLPVAAASADKEGGNAGKGGESKLTEGNGPLSSPRPHSPSQKVLMRQAPPLQWTQMYMYPFHLAEPLALKLAHLYHRELPKYSRCTGRTTTFATSLWVEFQWSQPREKHGTSGKHAQLVLLLGQQFLYVQGRSDTSRSRIDVAARTRSGTENGTTMLSKPGHGWGPCLLATQVSHVIYINIKS